MLHKYKSVRILNMECQLKVQHQMLKEGVQENFVVTLAEIDGLGFAVFINQIEKREDIDDLAHRMIPLGYWCSYDEARGFFGLLRSHEYINRNQFFTEKRLRKQLK